MIWFTSDTHYNHKNICRGTSEWESKDSTRPFNTLEQMNNFIVNSINDYVQQNDTLYFLGDWSFGGIENIWNFRKRIICRDIHFINGNHDQHIKKNKLLEIPKSEESLVRKFIPNFNIEFMFGSNLLIEPQDLFTSIQNYFEIEINKQIFVLSHYPIEEWYEMDRKGSIHLHGHCHHNIDNCELNTIYKRMDIGIDWKEFRPFNIDEILRIMRKRINKQHLI